VKEKVRCIDCEGLKSAPAHNFGHPFNPPPKAGGFGSQKKALAPRSDRPGRVLRYQESQQGMQEHREAVRYCEGPARGLDGDCDGPLEQQHVIGRGMGGGKDHGELATLCRFHHRWVTEHPIDGKESGLVKKRPPIDVRSPKGRPSRFTS